MRRSNALLTSDVLKSHFQKIPHDYTVYLTVLTLTSNSELTLILLIISWKFDVADIDVWKIFDDYLLHIFPFILSHFIEGSLLYNFVIDMAILKVSSLLVNFGQSSEFYVANVVRAVNGLTPVKQTSLTIS